MDITVIHPHSHVARREESPDTTGQDSRRKSGHGSNRDGQCHRKQTAVPARETVRVKRWGKSPPLRGRPRRHGKPNPVQDEQGPSEVAHQGPGLSHRRKAGPQGQRNGCAGGRREPPRTESGLQCMAQKTEGRTETSDPPPLVADSGGRPQPRWPMPTYLRSVEPT